MGKSFKKMEGWLIMSGIEGGKMLRLQCTDLTKICLVFKFNTIWHCWELEGYRNDHYCDLFT